MRHVTPFEARLLRLLHATLGHAPASQALALIVQDTPRPPCLSRGAVELVQDALRKGMTARLARGGWRRERFLQGEAPIEGRLWRRHAPQRLALRFSGQS